MLVAGARKSVVEDLGRNNKHVSVIFTHDEEAPSAEMSYRGAKLAAGVIGDGGLITAKYFVDGEPTEFDGRMVPMRAHKGRWLMNFTVEVERPGHSAQDVQNALTVGAELAHEIVSYSRAMQQEVASDAADLFTPSYSTAQITGANAKDKDYSITPSKAGFTVDLRTLPHEHDTRVHELRRLITEFGLEEGATVRISELDNFEGTLTAPDSPIVRLAESVTRLVAQGFNGGDEGEVLRSKGMEGITLGPGEFIYAHTANEQISVDSVLNAIDIYAHIFRKSTNLL
jgi:acetylornithine deacetylase/succinyl-diaminopimelate desuccinylase-like protein